jgi:CxxC-x17-CxxC domain-containing protein
LSFKDKSLTCTECGANFVFSAEEQEQFQSRGYTNEPKRCSQCRAARKATSFGSNSSYDGASSRQQREMFPAVCGQCGKDTQVPFQPRGDRPVYCSDCFRAMPAKR